MKLENLSVSEQAANNIRLLSAAMVEKAKSGHPGGAMGGADFMHILFSEYLKFDPENPNWFFRDRFFLDPGHMSPMLYASLSLIKKFSLDELKEFRQWGSPTPGHPEIDFERGIENTSGPLGQGHTMAVGAAIAERFIAAKFGEWASHKTYAYISDGGIQEEISQGAGRLAGHLGLSNLIMFYDSNNIQLSTTVEEVTTEDVAKKYEAWGWKTLKIDGHDHDAIRKALDEANKETAKPTIIIATTVMGKGAVDGDGASYESKTSTHGQPLSAAGASFEKTVENLGAEASEPFVIFPDVAKYYDEVLKAKSEEAAKLGATEKEWRSANGELAAKLDSFIDRKLPDLGLESLDQKQGAATRGASASVLGHLADKLENLIVASADLSNSDKTDGYLKKTQAITKDDFTGKFLQMGVSELTMAAVANGMAIHGGVIPACGTFFVFSDYMKPAMRLSALMQLPVIFIWTHDAFRVGEDGPTHQPIEHEAQLRLMERLKNHEGKPSLLVLRPADADETSVAWSMALENAETPTALLFSRQNIPSLPGKDGNRQAEAWEAKKGGYIVKAAEGTPDIVLFGNGSEVSTLFLGAELLEAKGYKVQVSSIISEGLFNQQDEAYKKQVLPEGIKRLGMTAGLPDSLDKLAGANGFVFGLDHFGYSAPAGVLDEKFGFTAANVEKLALDLLK